MSELPRGDEHLMQLLADEATEGLTWSQQNELGQLLEVHPEVGPEELEHAAATATLAMMEGSMQPLPPRIRVELLSNATCFFSTRAVAPSRPIVQIRWNDQDYL
jgi:hypothetical protein